MACPKHDPTNGHASYKAKQKTTKVNVEVKVLELNLSSLIMQLCCQINQKNITIFYLTWHGYTHSFMYLKNPNYQMGHGIM
jgi:hypothetical protein